MTLAIEIPRVRMRSQTVREAPSTIQLSDIDRRPPAPIKPAHEGFFDKSDAKRALRVAGIDLALKPENLDLIFETVRRRVFDLLATQPTSFSTEGPMTQTRTIDPSGERVAILKEYNNQGLEGSLISLVGTSERRGRLRRSVIVELTSAHGRNPLISVYRRPRFLGKKPEFIGAIGGGSVKR